MRSASATNRAGLPALHPFGRLAQEALPYVAVIWRPRGDGEERAPHMHDESIERVRVGQPLLHGDELRDRVADVSEEQEARISQARAAVRGGVPTVVVRVSPT